MRSLSTSTPKKRAKLSITSKFFTALLLASFTILLTACVAPEAQIGLTDLSARPAEKALLAGIRSYEEAQYAEAEKSLSTSLTAGFTVPKDAALAHKYLAFIYCTSARVEECKRAFIAAHAVDPSFVLSKKEVGHPQWGPVYKQTLGH
jgi:Tfp pilus assembly protein PilF